MCRNGDVVVTGVPPGEMIPGDLPGSPQVHRRAATEVQKFVCDLEEFLNVPVDSVDERLSSAEARKSGTGKKENEHAIAAQKILQAYLESREHKG